jgi:hypothetical protein
VDIERPGFTIILEPPDLVEQLFAWNDPPFVPRENRKQSELFASQPDALVLAGDRESRIVDSPTSIVIGSWSRAS